ncbi:MAG: cobaltochelatase subunit CobN, partial [Acidaminococcaceae bacterium]
IADVYVRWGAHAYGGKTRGKFLPERFRKRMGSLDITVKNEDNVETNMLSSDDYNAYHGGMIAAVRSIKGSAPKSYCGDTTDRSKVILRSVQEETKRIFRGEATNPKFIAGMMQHGYKGASDLANYVAHSYQWDATSEVMEDWMYEKFAEKYAFAPQVQEWMQKVNPWALQRIAEVLLEAEQRGLWQAQPETKKALQKLYLSIEGELEERSDD